MRCTGQSAQAQASALSFRQCDFGAVPVWRGRTGGVAGLWKSSGELSWGIAVGSVVGSREAWPGRGDCGRVVGVVIGLGGIVAGSWESRSGRGDRVRNGESWLNRGDRVWNGESWLNRGSRDRTVGIVIGSWESRPEYVDRQRNRGRTVGIVTGVAVENRSESQCQGLPFLTVLRVLRNSRTPCRTAIG